MIDYQLNRIIQILDKFEQMDYIGEEVSQLEHALQCAYFAKRCKHDTEVIIASLLHDIGHVASRTKQPQMAELGVINHEWIGAKLVLEMGFSKKVSELIGHHVNAKRYLAASKKAYYQRLSEASKGTLAFQGGPMARDELAEFKKLEHFKQILQVRTNDEKGKVENFEHPNLDDFLALMRQHLECQIKNNIPKEKTIHILFSNEVEQSITQSQIETIINEKQIEIALSNTPQAINSALIYDFNLSVNETNPNFTSYIEETMRLIDESVLSSYLLVTSASWFERAKTHYPKMNFKKIEQSARCVDTQSH